MQLEEWFLTHKRLFPWRENPTPYRVWISEVMLQQTRASVVISYFERWMQLFPTIKELGNAPLEHIIKAWEGLGYYSRARNLHAAAQIINHSYAGEIPSSKAELATLPGLGPYTIGAILSFGFRQRSVAIDGNVTRVVTRFAWIDEEVTRSSAKRKIEAETDKLLSLDKPSVSMEALIELGATICTPTPTCERCPLQGKCVAHSRGMPTLLPLKKEAPKIEKISRGVAIIEADGAILVRKNSTDVLMGDLWEFPYFDGIISSIGLRKKLSQILDETPVYVERMEIVQHSFTRFLAKLFPYKFTMKRQIPLEGFSWISLEKLSTLPFSSGHRKLVKQLYMAYLCFR